MLLWKQPLEELGWRTSMRRDEVERIFSEKQRRHFADKEMKEPLPVSSIICLVFMIVHPAHAQAI